MTVSRTKVLRSGNSAVVTLPAGWRKRSGVTFGDELVLSYDDAGPISIDKAPGRPDDRQAAMARLEEFVAGLPDAPWDDDSPEADRALLGGRYV